MASPPVGASVGSSIVSTTSPPVGAGVGASASTSVLGTCDGESLSNGSELRVGEVSVQRTMRFLTYNIGFRTKFPSVGMKVGVDGMDGDGLFDNVFVNEGGSVDPSFESIFEDGRLVTPIDAALFDDGIIEGRSETVSVEAMVG